MAVNSANGSRFSIGTTLACANLADYQSDVFTAVGEVEDLGEFGDESAEIVFTSLADGRVRKFKGPRNAGTVNVTCGDDPNNVGQDAMVVAEASTLDYNFRVEFNDAPTVSGTPSVHYFSGKVMSKKHNVGNASNIIKRMFAVGINSQIFSVDAA